ncbi:serine hydrolase [Mycobacterium sp. MS1601]|uniref:serine hydrolase n=1 Tax=Mycobacterium sp. MS1601 TaxID=1936029 RepID=UPI00178CAFB6|nr:serine hydrolase [Mycobacterium sp. MS1601]
MPPPNRNSLALLGAAVLTASVISGCAPSSTPPANAGDAGVRISTGTPQGVRAKQIMDMLNSGWPIGPDGTKTLAAPDLVEYVWLTMDSMWYDRPYTLAGVEFGAGTATLRLVTSYGGRQDIELRVNDGTLLDRFRVTNQPPQIDSWDDVDAALSKTGGKYSYRVSRVTDGRCVQLAGSNTAESLPLASIFKMYVLYAVADAARAGTLSWDEELTITSEAKAVGSSGFDKLPPGSRVPVRLLAEKMIANSDNMATDLLMARVGHEAVERALVATGHHDPASMTPFPTMHELFSIGWGKPDVREEWKNATPARRAELLKETNSRPYEPDPTRNTSPASAYGAEWYGNAEDICRVHAALQRIATDPAAAPVRDIMSTIPGIDLDPKQWPYIGAKAGNLPGDLTFSWYAEDRSGQGWVVSLQTNFPRFHGPGTAGWLMSVIKPMFAMIPHQN